MTLTTGYTDGFNRTVSNGLGAADSGQAYTLVGAASQFSTSAGTATIAIASSGDKIGYVDTQTQNVDVSGQVAFTAIPATNLTTAGFAVRLSSSSNYYVGSLLVATGGALSIRLSKVTSGTLFTLSTVSLGVTYTANTFYNLRYSVVWSQATQTNVMSLKAWAVGTTQPGGWQAQITDASVNLNQYAGGTSVGIHARDEATTPGSVSTKYRSVATLSYHLPMPASTDTACADPSVTYPKQTALQSLASAADAVMVGIDPLVTTAGNYPRVRVSNTGFVITTSQIFITPTFATTEYNVGTSTNLGYDATGIYLPVGMWMVQFEIQMANAAAAAMAVTINGGPLIGQQQFDMRSNASQSNDNGVGGTGHISTLTYVTDPTTPMKYYLTFAPSNTSTTYTVKYMALSAIKVSDYFT